MRTLPTTLLLLFVAYLPSSNSIPHSIDTRQSPFASLALPRCALQCFITSITTDGCNSETDFQCHCTKGNILSAASGCLGKQCDEDDKSRALEQVKAGCKAVGVDLGDHGGDKQTGSSTSMFSTVSSMPASTLASSSFESITPTLSAPSNRSPSNPTSNPTVASTSIPPSTEPSTTSPLPSSTKKPPMPTDTPLALLPSDRQLSAGAKAGISVSVTTFASAIIITIALYIRRLKRDLKAAQAAAGVPESVWRAHISTAAAPGPIARRTSWRGSRRGRSPPTSPLSPLSPTSALSGGGSVLKKKRNHVLSIVVEGSEEGETASMEQMIREPVPGQREGLVDPLELDGDGIVELPTSVTPRTRSRERSRERGSSIGEKSRTSLEERRRWMG